MAEHSWSKGVEGACLILETLAPACSEGRLYLAWLTKQLKSAGGRLAEQQVQAVEELARYDGVVNCSGMDWIYLSFRMHFELHCVP